MNNNKREAVKKRRFQPSAARWEIWIARRNHGNWEHREERRHQCWGGQRRRQDRGVGERKWRELTEKGCKGEEEGHARAWTLSWAPQGAGREHMASRALGGMDAFGRRRGRAGGQWKAVAFVWMERLGRGARDENRAGSANTGTYLRKGLSGLVDWEVLKEKRQ